MRHEAPGPRSRSKRLPQQITVSILMASIVNTPVVDAGKLIPDKYNPIKIVPKVLPKPIEITIEKATEGASHLAKEAVEEAEKAGKAVGAVGKKADSEILQPTKDGLIHLGGEIDDVAIQPARKGLLHLGEQTAQEMKKAGKSVESYVDKHSGAIVLAVVVGGMIYLICPCNVFVMGMKVGSIKAGLSGGGLTLLSVPADAKSSAGNGSSADSEAGAAPDADPDTAGSTGAVSQAPRIDPNELTWRYDRLLTNRTHEPGFVPDSDVSESVGEATGELLKEIIFKDAPSGGRVAELGGGPLGVFWGIVLEPTETAPPAISEYSDEVEVSARLDRLVERAMMIEEVRLANDPMYERPKPWIPPPDWTLEKARQPVLQAAPPPRVPGEPSIKVQIEVKAIIVSELTKLTPAEVEARVREGLAQDKAARRQFHTPAPAPATETGIPLNQP